jgi:hypothetical protein
MVAVVAGDPWSPEEADHLASCPDCTREWSIVERGSRVGSQLAALDPDRIVGRVRERLRHEPRASGRTPIPFRTARRWALGLAAAAALFLVVRASLEPDFDDESPRVGVLTELDELTGAELETLLTTIVTEDPMVRGDESDLGDLTHDELERLLDSWERS